jgi:hypothetical protein
MWTSNIPVPLPQPPTPAANIEGQTTGELKLSLGLKFLAATLSAMGARIPDLGFAYSRASTVQFVFANVRAVEIDPLTVGDFLSRGDLHVTNPFVQRYFLDDDADAFIVTEVLQSDQLLVTARTERATELTVDVPAIQQIVGANVAVSTRNAAQTQVGYKGSDFLTFAFKAYSVAFRNGRWAVEGSASDVGLSVSGVGVAARPIVLREGTLLLR